MYQLQNIDYLYRISTMTGSSKLVTVQADRDSHDLNDKHFVMLNLCRAIVNFANEGHVMMALKTAGNIPALNNKKDKRVSFPVVVHRAVLPSKS